MFVGDLTGALIMLYAMKGILTLLPQGPGNSRISNGMFRIQVALNSAYNNQSARQAA